MGKILKISQVDSFNGEMHFVLEEPETPKDCECLTDMHAIKEISKNEATKPLLLFREE